MAAGKHVGPDGMLRMHRRMFLGAAGLTAVGLAGSRQVVGGWRPTAHSDLPPNQVTDDPIVTFADSLGYDQEAIFRFVADEVAYEPYAGVLRGPQATLAARAGNAADKALLLAALLDAALVETRFITGTLDEEAERSLAGTTVDADVARERARAALTAGIPRQPPSGDIPPEARAIIDRLPEIDRTVTAWASGAVETSVHAIVDALAGAGITLPVGMGALPATERTRHVWIQARSGADWVDLDPTTAGALAGHAIAVASGEPLAALPDDMRHRIDIAVIGERIAGTGLEQEALIEHSLFADQLTDVPMAITHVKPEGLKGVGVSIDSMLSGGVRYQPILQVGDSAIIGVTGVMVAGGEPGVLDALGSTDREGEATAEWLELRVTAPDGSLSTTRRTLFDRIGDTARMSGPIDPTTIPQVELVDLGPDGPAEYLPLRTVHCLSVATGASRRPDPAGDPADADDPAVAALRMRAPMYHVARDATSVALAVDRGVATYLDGPNIVAHSYALARSADGDPLTTETLDLLHRSFGSRPVAGRTADLPAGVLAGVISHVAERLRTGEGLPADLAFGAPGASVGAITERAIAEGIGLRVLRERLPADLPYPAEVAARITAALADGWVAVGPERPVLMGDVPRLGWWLVDPTTGATSDMLDDGRGAAMIETAILWAWRAFFATAFMILGACIASANRAVSDFLAAAGVGASVADVPIGKFACGLG